MKCICTLIILLLTAPLCTVAQTYDFEITGYVSDWEEDVLAGPTAITVTVDGEDVTFSTLFPRDYNNLNLRGKLAGDKVTFSKDEVCFQSSFWGVTLDYSLGFLKVGENDGKKIYSDPQDVVVRMIGGVEPEVIGDGATPDRYVCLYRINEEGGCEVRSYVYNLKFTPVETGDLVIVPASASVEDYMYSYGDDNYTAHEVKGLVAIDGNDYYFNGLTSTGGWMKGTREGNSITIAKDQYLGNTNGAILFGGGYHFPDQPDASGYYTPFISDFVLNISNSGETFTIANPNDNAVIAYHQNGEPAEINWDMLIKPYDERAGIINPIALPHNRAVGLDGRRPSKWLPVVIIDGKKIVL